MTLLEPPCMLSNPESLISDSRQVLPPSSNTAHCAQCAFPTQVHSQVHIHLSSQDMFSTLNAPVSRSNSCIGLNLNFSVQRQGLHRKAGTCWWI